MSQLKSLQGTWASTIVGSFSSILVTQSATSGNCAASTLGLCTLSDCAVIVPVDAGVVSTAPTNFSAGTLTLTNVLDGGLTIPPDVNNQYILPLPQERLWLDGVPLTISAAGATVPAFTLNADGPSDVVLTQPACGPTTCPAINRSSDLTVSWTGRSGLATFGLVAGLRSVVCQSPASAGQFVIPAAALSYLPAGNADLSVGAQVITPAQLVGPFLIQAVISGATTGRPTTLQ